MLFGHCSEIIGQENWSGSLDTAFITKENEQNSRFLCCHGQNIEGVHGENWFCRTVWLWHFHWERTEWRALTACICWTLDRRVIDGLVSWWGFCTMTTPLKHAAVSLSWSVLRIKLCLHLLQGVDYISFPIAECMRCFPPKEFDTKVLCDMACPSMITPWGRPLRPSRGSHWDTE